MTSSSTTRRNSHSCMYLPAAVYACSMLVNKKGWSGRQRRGTAKLANRATNSLLADTPLSLHPLSHSCSLYSLVSFSLSRFRFVVTPSRFRDCSLRSFFLSFHFVSTPFFDLLCPDLISWSPSDLPLAEPRTCVIRALDNREQMRSYRRCS